MHDSFYAYSRVMQPRRKNPTVLARHRSLITVLPVAKKGVAAVTVCIHVTTNAITTKKELMMERTRNQPTFTALRDQDELEGALLLPTASLTPNP